MPSVADYCLTTPSLPKARCTFHSLAGQIYWPQVLCHIVPSLVKLRKEGLDAQEKIKIYIWWASLTFAILEAVILACFSLQYSIYASTHRYVAEVQWINHICVLQSLMALFQLNEIVKHVIVTTLFLVCGAMTMTWICDKISESGFVSSAKSADRELQFNLLEGAVSEKAMPRHATQAIFFFFFFFFIIFFFLGVT
ncbi:hypothetical protein V2J09_016663 [Rumex salicifolius]